MSQKIKIPVWKRVVEYLAFVYFDWIIVIPSLIPFMLFWVGVSEEQLLDWLFMSLFTSLYIGWVVVKGSSIFAPWFYRKIGIKRNICECCGK